jgi:hypothetical protein
MDGTENAALHFLAPAKYDESAPQAPAIKSITSPRSASSPSAIVKQKIIK